MSSNQTIKPFYEALSAQIKANLPEIQYIALYNNQFDRSNSETEKNNKQKAFQYPAVFLEFNNFQFRQLGLGVEEFDFQLIVHFGWKSFLTEDLKQLDMLECLYYTVERFQQGNSARLFRVSEQWDTNRTDVGITRITYRGYMKDFSRCVLNNYYAYDSITGVTTTVEYVPFSTDTSNNNFSLFSGATDDNGQNSWDGELFPPQV